MRHSEHHLLRRLTNAIHYPLGDSSRELKPRGRIRESGFGEHDKPFGCCRWLFRTECHYATLAYTIHFTHHFLYLIWIDVSSTADDDVLDATCDIQLAPGQIRAITRITPDALHQTRCCLRISKIAGCCRWAGELQGTLDPFGHFQAGIVNDAYAIAREGLTAGNESKRVPGALRLRHRPTFTGQMSAVHAVNDRAAAYAWNRQSHGGFGQTEHGSHRLGSKAMRGEPSAEPLDSIRIYRLSAVERNAQAREVEACKLLIAKAPRAQLIAEVG